MRGKPLFNWVPPPDGQMRTNRELVDYCVSIQSFFFSVKEMNADQVRATFPDEVLAVKEVAIEYGIQYVERQWFAKLFR